MESTGLDIDVDSMVAKAREARLAALAGRNRSSIANLSPQGRPLSDLGRLSGDSPPFVKWDHVAAEVLFGGRFGSKMVLVSSMAQATRCDAIPTQVIFTSLEAPEVT
jgi:hypothetical protein